MWNNITGSIPKEIGNITTLELLWVENLHYIQYFSIAMFSLRCLHSIEFENMLQTYRMSKYTKESKYSWVLNYNE